MPWAQVASLSPDQGHAVARRGRPRRCRSSGPRTEGETLALKRDVLDRQIIDTQGRKVVRVNDIALEAEGGRLFLRRVDSRPRRRGAPAARRPRRAALRAAPGRGLLRTATSAGTTSASSTRARPRSG